MVGGEAAATVQTAACEVGQGLVTVLQQIVRTELGVERVTILPVDTTIGNAGSTSASRQTYVTGGAVLAACLAVRASLTEQARRTFGLTGELSFAGGKLTSTVDGVVAELAAVIGDGVLDETVEWRHRPTETLDPETGAGNAHVQYSFAAHRAVVDVD